MKVKDCMHRGVEWVGPDATIVEIARIMREEDIGSVPIGENDRLAGMVTDRDIVCRGVAGGENCTDVRARDVMSKPIIYVHEDDDLEDAIRLMEKNRIRRLPVIDKNKRLAGMLSLGDITDKAGEDVTAQVLDSVAEHHA